MMNVPRYYILNDQNVAVLVDLYTWARWFEANDNHRIVQKTDLAGGVLVSTVFLGLDHAFTEDEPRKIFETLVFGGPHDGEMDRYATWAQAEAGHAAMVQKVSGATVTRRTN